MESLKSYEQSNWIHKSGNFNYFSSGGLLTRYKDYSNLGENCKIRGFNLLGYNDSTLSISISLRRIGLDDDSSHKPVFKYLSQRLNVAYEFTDEMIGTIYIRNISDPNTLHKILDVIEEIEEINPHNIKNDMCQSFGAKEYVTPEKILQIIEKNSDDIVKYIKEFYKRYTSLFDSILKHISKHKDIKLINSLLELDLSTSHKKELILIKLNILRETDIDKTELINIIKQDTLWSDKSLLDIRNKLIMTYIHEDYNKLDDPIDSHYNKILKEPNTLKVLLDLLTKNTINVSL